MNKGKPVKIIITVIIITAVVVVFCLVEAFDHTQSKTGTKTEKQSLSEKDGAGESLWEKYVSSTSREAYQEAKDYLAGIFQKKAQKSDSAPNYALHENISTTIFWTGEKASGDNHDISNSPSCWDDKWSSHFGGIDHPNKRNGYFPAGFNPKENPFYFALPYNDFNSKGNRKSGLDAYIPWFDEKKWGNKESVCKNQWIKIVKGDKIAYAQWEDAGPFGENDIEYVFRNAQPKSKTNDHAGLDVSPAVRDFLSLSDVDKTSWQFVDDKDVPNGPWKKIVTNSNIYWN